MARCTRYALEEARPETVARNDGLRKGRILDKREDIGLRKEFQHRLDHIFTAAAADQPVMDDRDFRLSDLAFKNVSTTRCGLQVQLNAHSAPRTFHDSMRVFQPGSRALGPTRCRSAA